MTCRTVFLLGSALLLLAQASDALAQSAGQLVPRSFAPEVNRTPGGVTFPDLKDNNAPPGAEKLSLTLGAVAIDGGDPALASASDAIIAGLRGRKATVAEIYAAVARIEALYADNGYFLTRVTIPQQTVKPGGTLRLAVTEGFVESIDTSAVPERARGRVDAIVQGLAGRRKLTLSQFQRALLIAGDTAGLALASRLTTGSATGAVKLVLSGAHRLVSGELSVDNSLSTAIGTWSSQLTAQINSPFGFGEQFYFAAAGSPGNGLFADTSPRRLLAVGANLPVGPDGLTVNPEYSWSTTYPIVTGGALQTQSLFQRWSLRASYPLIRSRSDTLMIRAAFDATDEQQSAPGFGNALLSQDRLRVLRGGVDWAHVFSETATLLNLGGDLSQGIKGLGSRSSAEATALVPLSRQGADDTFSKLELRAKLKQELPFQFALEGTAKAQWALSGPLLRSEQFSLGGARQLSAYDASAMTGDSGWLLRGELQYQAVTQVFAHDTLVVPYLFAARGQVTLLQPTAVELAQNGATSLGFGARTTVISSDFLIRQSEFGFEAARQLSDNPGAVADQWRVNVFASLRF